MIANILPKLQKVRQTGRQTWIACCPAHSDKTPSLSLRELPDGRVLMHCFGGCEVDAVLGAAGVSFDELFPPNTQHHAGFNAPFPARDVLEAIANESLIVLLAARAMSRGEKLGSDRVERLATAAQRIEEGRRLANGH